MNFREGRKVWSISIRPGSCSCKLHVSVAARLWLYTENKMGYYIFRETTTVCKFKLICIERRSNQNCSCKRLISSGSGVLGPTRNHKGGLWKSLGGKNYTYLNTTTNNNYNNNGNHYYYCLFFLRFFFALISLSFYFFIPLFIYRLLILIMITKCFEFYIIIVSFCFSTFYNFYIDFFFHEKIYICIWILGSLCF